MSRMPQGETLTKEMAEALPLYCYVDKHTRQTLLQNGVAISEKTRLEIIDVRYMGEAGGIMCIINHPEGDGKIVMSATNFCFTDKGLIYDKINEYKKARIKWLQQEEMKDRMFGLNERVKSFSTCSSIKTIDSLEKISRNDPCPCGSGKKYKHCCLK